MLSDKIIVLMPVRQAAEFLNETFECLYQLDPQPDLYIFGENNSTDDTLEIISKFDGSKKIIRLWFRDDVLDYCETRFDILGIIRQFLLQAARHLDPDFIIFLDSDIRVRSPDLITRLTRWREQADIIGGPYLRYTPLGLRVAAIWPGWWHRPNRTSAVTLEDVMVVGGGCMRLPRKVLQDRRLNFYPVKHENLALENELFRREASTLGFPPRLGDLAEDIAYCLEAWYLGYSIGLDWTILLDHWIDGQNQTLAIE